MSCECVLLSVWSKGKVRDEDMTHYAARTLNNKEMTHLRNMGLKGEQ